MQHPPFDLLVKGIIAAMFMGSPSAMAAKDVAVPESTPQLVVPKTRQAPTIDGVLGEGEWDRAAAVSGFIGATGREGGLLTSPDARIYLTHDGEYLYIAVDCELLPGMVPSRKYRKRDEPVYMDSNQVEVWLTPPTDGQVATFQTVANAYGAVFDIRSVPELGAESVGWNANWETANRFERGQRWVSEMRVPFKDFDGAKPNPQRSWGGLVAVAWPQRSWPYTGGWYKNIKNHARYTFADDGTGAQLLDIRRLADGELAPQLRLINDAEEPGSFTVRFTVGQTTHEQVVTVPAKSVLPYKFEVQLPDAGQEKQVCIGQVLGPQGQNLLAGQWSFVTHDDTAPKVRKSPEPQLPFATRVRFGPETRGVELWADLLDYPKREALAAVRFTVTPTASDQPIAEQIVTQFAYDSAETLIWLPETMPVGEYVVTTTYLDENEKALDQKEDRFTYTDLAEQFHWFNNTLGETRRVAAPFKPVTLDSKTFRVWGREYVMDGALPTQVVSLDAPMLASPAALVAEIDGRKVIAEPTERFTLIKSEPHRATFRGAYRLPGLVLRLTGTIEMDGMVLYDLTVEPDAEDADIARIERLYFALPVKAEHATSYYSTAGGWSGAFGLIPQADGPVWSSDSTADFVPYVGLTDDHRAIQWFADNDHGWAIGDALPCATIHRDGDTVELQVNLLRRAEWDGRLNARFGLIATPIKPLPAGWRNTSLDNVGHFGSKTNLFYGEGHGGNTIPIYDSPTLAEALGREVKDLSHAEVDALLAAAPPTQWDQAMLDALPFDKQKNARTRKLFASDRGEGSRPCYFWNAQMLFEGNRSEAFRTFFPAEWQRNPPSGWFHLTPTESYRDFFSFYVDLWMKHWFMPGMYFDEVYFAPDYNRFNGNGKLMPDGSVRPSVALLAQREMMWRMWQLFHDNGREPFIWIHSSNFMAPHANGVAQVAMFGEDRAPNRSMDYVDATPAVLMRTIGRAQKFGYIPIWMDQAGRGGFHAGSRQVWGWVWLHDAVPEYHTSSFTLPTLGMRVAWGLAEDDVRYQPYWDNPGVTRSDDQFLVSTWTRPGKAMLMIFNLHRDAEQTQVKLDLDAEKLGLPSDFRLYNLESKAAVVAARAAADDWFASRDAPDAAQKMKRALDLARDEEPFSSYRLEELTDVGGTQATVTVPARDWIILIAE